MSHFTPFFRRALYFGSAAVAVVLGTAGWITTANGETWTSLRGTHSVQARMVGLWDDNVVLELAGGRRITVKLNALRSESRIQAQELAKKLASSRAERINELRVQATDAAAPAPNPLPQPAAAQAYVAPQPGVTVGEFLQQLDDAVSKGHILAIYDAMPPSYRSDVDELVKLSTQKINPVTWQALVGGAYQIGDLLVTRQKWLLSSPRLEAAPPEELESIQRDLINLASVLRAGLHPDRMQLQKLQSMNFREWLTEIDTAVAPHLAHLVQQMGDAATRTITVDSEDASKATVTIERDGESTTVDYLAVDGYWVPKVLADQWTDSVAEKKTQLAEAAAGTVLQSYAEMLQPFVPDLVPLAQAGNANDFHAAMETGLPNAETVVSTLVTTLGPAISLASRGGAGGGFGGYEGYDDSDEEMGEEDEDYDPFASAFAEMEDEE